MADFNQHNLLISHDHVLGTIESASTIRFPRTISYLN